MKNRVVITGMGLITPIGLRREGFWKATQLGTSGVGPVTRFDAAGFPTRIAAEVKEFEPQQYIERKAMRRMDRFTQMALCAAHMSLEDARLNLEREDRDRIGVFVGSGIGGIETYEQQYQVLLDRGPGRINPFFIPMLISNMAGSQIAIELGLKGPNMCIVSACASATNSIGEAMRLLQRGDAEVMLAGGTEASITPLALAGFCSMRALSTRNEEPTIASRPFDRDRDGFVMGEGAGVLVLENLEHALRRNAPILAELVGYASNCDAYHVVQPGPEGLGAGRAMAEAIADSGLQPDDIDYINAHGTGTELNDLLETRAIKRVFGDHAWKLAVSSTKSMTGHLLGASGAVELAAAVLAVHHGWLPPTINLDHPEPECDLDYVPQKGRPADIRAALSNSLGFGGHNRDGGDKAMGVLETEKRNADSIEIYALVGAAGTGKSHRALSLAHEIGVDLIIDDGLLIKGSRILAGRSAKSEKLIFTATRRALFQDPEHVREVKERLAEEKPRKVLVLGISENMVRRISENLGLPQPREIIPIEKLASEKDLQTARRLRMVDKRHVVPVLSMDVNRNAVGQLIESFTVIFRKKNDRQVLGENSVVRPAYSSIGKITIAETVIKALSINSARAVKGVVDAQMLSLQVNEGMLTLDIGLKLVYGPNLRPVLEEVRGVVFETLTSLTGMNIRAVNVIARELAMTSAEEKGRNQK